MTTIVCDIFELRKAIKGLKPAFPSTVREQNKLVFELDIRPQLLTITIPGASIRCPTQFGTFAKAFIPFPLFKKIVRICREDVFNLNIETGKLTLGKTSIKSKRIIATHFENQTKIDLSVNYSTLEILSLRYNHTYEEIKRRNLHTLLDTAEEKLLKDIRTAANALSDYKVSYSGIEALVHAQIIKHKT